MCIRDSTQRQRQRHRHKHNTHTPSARPVRPQFQILGVGGAAMCIAHRAPGEHEKAAKPLPSHPQQGSVSAATAQNCAMSHTHTHARCLTDLPPLWDMGPLPHTQKFYERPAGPRFPVWVWGRASTTLCSRKQPPYLCKHSYAKL